MTHDEIINTLFGSYKNFKGTELVISLIKNNSEFKQIVEFGIKNGLLKGFDEAFFSKIAMLNMRGYGTLVDAFEMGLNIGACTAASKLVSYIFNSCQIAGGTNKFLVGTKNSEDGSHTWIIGPDGLIYDTSFMLIFSNKLSKEMGYTIENIVDPNFDQYYSAGKEFARDANLRSSNGGRI